MTNLNKCARCSKELDRSEFYADKRNKSGLQSACKQCGKDRKNSIKTESKPDRLKPKKAVQKKNDKSLPDDIVNAVRNAKSLDLSMHQIIKLGEGSRFKTGVARIKKKGYIVNISADSRTVLTKPEGFYLSMKIRADGVLFNYESELLKSKKEVNERADYVYENAKQIISKKLDLKEVDHNVGII